MRKKIYLSDLPENFQLQARRQLEAENRTVVPLYEHRASAQGNTCTGLEKANTTQIKRKREPNKTEAAYNRIQLNGSGRYEGITLHLPGGSRYTPDWVTTGDDGKVVLHEVKGSYRLGSQGRAVTAFKEAAAAWPEFSFVWASKGKDGTWNIKQWS